MSVCVHEIQFTSFFESIFLSSAIAYVCVCLCVSVSVSICTRCNHLFPFYTNTPALFLTGWTHLPIARCHIRVLFHSKNHFRIIGYRILHSHTISQEKYRTVWILYIRYDTYIKYIAKWTTMHSEMAENLDRATAGVRLSNAEADKRNRWGKRTELDGRRKIWKRVNVHVQRMVDTRHTHEWLPDRVRQIRKDKECTLFATISKFSIRAWIVQIRKLLNFVLSFYVCTVLLFLCFITFFVVVVVCVVAIATIFMACVLCLSI